VNLGRRDEYRRRCCLAGQRHHRGRGRGLIGKAL